jgi:MFS family permease
LQVPLGSVADIIGRRTAILFGLGCMVIEALLFASATTPAMIWIANLMWVLGYSMLFGADTALLYDSLQEAGREAEFKKVEGKANSYRLALAAVCALTVGYLAEINIRLPVYLSAVTMTINFVIAWFFIEPPLYHKHPSWCQYWQLMGRTVKQAIGSPQILWIIGLSVVIGVVSKVWFFCYNPYFEAVEIAIRYFGYIFFLLNLVSAVFSYLTDWLHRRLGDRGSVVLIVLVCSVPIYLMGVWISPLAALLVLTQNIARGYMGPLVGHLLNVRTSSENRATMLSLKATALYLGESVGLQLFGCLLGYWTLFDCLQLLGGVSLAFGLVLIVSQGLIFGKKSV